MVIPATYDVDAMTAIPQWLRGVYQKGKAEGRWGTEVEMAQALGFNAPTMNRWITGQRNPGPIFCLKLARVLDTPVDDVLRMAGHSEMSALFT